MKEEYMLLAIDEAKKAAMMGEVPVGAVIVKDNVVLAKACNLKEKSNCCISHAEILAVEKASKILNNWRLSDCDMYVTLEPCPMCASAIKQSRIKNVYCGLSNKDKNNSIIIKAIFEKDLVNNKVNYSCGYFSEEIKKIMNDFFSNIR